MRRIAITAVSLLILLTLAGCTGNLFMEWDKPDVPSADEISKKDVSSQSGADDFLSDVEDWYEGDALSGDKDKSVAVVEKLKLIYDDSSDSIDPETEQQAAALAGKIAIQSDPNADQLSKNLIGSYDELTNGFNGTADEFIKSLIPDAALNDKDSFTNMLNALLDSSDAYKSLGENIGTNGSLIVDSELGNAVQLGAVAVAIEAALDALDGTVGGAYNNTEVTQTDRDDLWDIVQGNETFDTVGADDPLKALDSDSSAYSGFVSLLVASELTFDSYQP